MSVILKLTERDINSLTTTEKRVYNYLVINEVKTINKSIRELANDIYVSASTIIKFLKKIGYNGYLEYKYDLLRNDQPVIINPNQKNVNQIESLDITQIKNNLDYPLLKKVVDKMRDSKMIYVFAVGVERFIAQEFTAKLQLLNVNCYYTNDIYDMRNLLKNEDNKKIVFYISNLENDLLEISNLNTKIESVLITSQHKSPFMTKNNFYVSSKISGCNSPSNNIIQSDALLIMNVICNTILEILSI